MEKKLEFTESAKNQIKKIIKNDGKKYFRIAVHGGGCSGFKYEFDFVAPPENDELYRKSDYNGLEVYCDRKSYMFLSGTEIDYEETIMSSGFTFNSPYAQRACGCGESVSFDLNKDIEQ